MYKFIIFNLVWCYIAEFISSNTFSVGALWFWVSCHLQIVSWKGGITIHSVFLWRIGKQRAWGVTVCGVWGGHKWWLSTRVNYLFFSNLDNFYFFSCLTAMAKTSNTVLDRSGESRHLCLVSEFSRKAFLVFHQLVIIKSIFNAYT